MFNRIKRFYYLKIKRSATAYFRSLGVNIGQECEIYPSASFGSEPYLITLGNHVRVNAHVTFVTHDGGAWVLRGLAGAEIPEQMKNCDKFGKITVGDNVHIGTNTIIMPGVSIGNNCIIGCGAVVTRDIPDNSVAVGIPARVIESIEEYYSKNKDDFDYTKGFSPEKKKEFLKNKFGEK